MRMFKLGGLVLALVFSISASAYSTDDERIESYLEALKTPVIEAQVKMLERLQWSGLSSPKLYDAIERVLIENAGSTSNDIIGDKRKLLAYSLRALGYSGNPKYTETITMYRNDAVSGSLSKYAKKALPDINKYGSWHRQINASQVNTEGKSSEVASYMKMLSVNDVFLQRQAARAIFHERQTDEGLIALTAEKFKAVYMDTSIDKQATDTAAWLCKAISQSGNLKYRDLILDAANNSPHRKVQKYAKKYPL